MNALSDKYITEITVPVSYYNIPDEFVMVGDYPEEVFVQVSGRGFTLIKYTLGSISLPFRLNLQPYFSATSDNDDNIRFQYYMSSKKEQIEQFLNDELKVIDVTPGNVYLNFDRLFTKNIRIVPKSEITYAGQYRQKEQFKVIPDSALIYGPKTLVDTLKYIYTETFIDEKVSENKEYEVNLICPDQCKITPKKAKVILLTEQFTENTLKLPIRIINKPDSITLTIFPQDITVKYLVSFDNYKNITADNFQAAIDYNHIKKQNTPQELDINLLYVPSQVKVLKYWPESARFIITEKQ